MTATPSGPPTRLDVHILPGGLCRFGPSGPPRVGGIGLRFARVRRGMSQRALAAATGITQQNISRLELGHSNGDPESWRSMEAVLRIPVAELMERD